MKKIANALLCVSMLGAAAAHAEGLSVGGSLASTKWKGDDIGGVSTDKSATGGKIYGGYSFTPNFGLEAGYATFGKYKSAAGNVKAEIVGGPAVSTVTSDWSSRPHSRTSNGPLIGYFPCALSSCCRLLCQVTNSLMTRAMLERLVTTTPPPARIRLVSLLAIFAFRLRSARGVARPPRAPCSARQCRRQ